MDRFIEERKKWVYYLNYCLKSNMDRFIGFNWQSEIAIVGGLKSNMDRFIDCIFSPL